jgi:hypothetical protein
LGIERGERGRKTFPLVMAGLDPAIHVFARGTKKVKRGSPGQQAR